MHSGAPANGRTTSMARGPRHPPLPQLDIRDAVYPMYSPKNDRRRSFMTWNPGPGLPSVDELVTLGFFYAGNPDCVRCFYCGVGLRSWELGDLPAEVHARWRPTCEYLRLVKGDNFINTVVNAVGNVFNNAEPLALHPRVLIAATDGGLYLRPSISVVAQCQDDLD